MKTILAALMIMLTCQASAFDGATTHDVRAALLLLALNERCERIPDRLRVLSLGLINSLPTRVVDVLIANARRELRPLSCDELRIRVDLAIDELK